MRLFPYLICLGIILTTFEKSNGQTISSIPFNLGIYNQPEACFSQGDSVLVLEAKGKTNLFISPNGKYKATNAPMVLFEPDESFTFTAKLTARLKAVYDVAALVIFQDSSHWAKLCYEYSVEKQPTIVSVVTNKVSDDCNSMPVDSTGAWLAIIKNQSEFSFHYSADGQNWAMIRHFKFDTNDHLKLGFAVHGSRGDGLTGQFSDINYSKGVPENLRSF